MTELIGNWALVVLFGLMAAIHPHAAAGAAFGCFFFLAAPHRTNRRQRLYLAVFSFGIGYALGVFAYGGGPPFNQKAMFVSGSCSALAAVVWTGLHRMADVGGPLPQWVKDILGYIPLFRRKGPDDGA